MRSFEYHLVKALGVDAETVIHESVQVQFLGNYAHVTWSGGLLIDSPEFQTAVAQAKDTYEEELSG